MPAYAMNSVFTIRECTGDDCRLRMPVTRDELPAGLCPRCAREMRIVESGTIGEDRCIRWENDLPSRLNVLVDNVRSVFNVGAILRVAEGVGMWHVHLCGITPTPEHRKLAKTALGAESNIAWSYHSNALNAAIGLVESGHSLWALENLPGAPSLFDSKLSSGDVGVVLIVGNEVTGVDPALLAISHRVLHLPMHGSKGSLNVAVTLGIAAYWLRGHTESTANGGSAMSSSSPS